MSTILRNTAEAGVSSGTALTTANSAVPNAFTGVTLGTGGAVTFSSTAAFKGGLGFLCSPAAGQTCYWSWDNTAGGSTSGGIALRFYFRFATMPATTDQTLFDLRTAGGGTSIAGLRMNHSTGVLIAWDNAGNAAITGGTTTGALAVNTWYRIEVAVSNATGAGTYTLRVYAGDSTTSISNMDLNLTGLALSSSSGIGTVRLGRPGAIGDAFVSQWDDIAFQVGSTGLLGPSASNVPPTASAGAPITVTVGSTGTLSGTASDSDGVVASYAWSLVSALGGAAATLSSTTVAQPTVTPTAPGVLTYQLIATDDQGATSTPSTTTVYVPVTTVTPIALTSNPGGYTLVGSAADVPTALSDTDPTTYVQSPDSPATAVTERVRLAPLLAGAGLTVNVTHQLTASSSSGVATVTLYEGSTVRKVWTITPTTTAATTALSLTAGELAAIGSLNALDVEFSWHV